MLSGLTNKLLLFWQFQGSPCTKNRLILSQCTTGFKQRNRLFLVKNIPSKIMKHIQTLEQQVRALPAMNTTLLSKASEWSDEKTMLSSNTSSPQSSPAASRVCTICGDRAGHHLHYGAVACFSCRQFFRRGRSLAVQCITGLGFCSINKNNRTNCKYCRSVCSILYGSDIIGQMSIGQMGCNRLKSS